MPISRVLAAAMLLTTTPLLAQTENAFINAFNSDWTLPQNWSLGHVPTSSERAVIASNGSLFSAPATTLLNVPGGMAQQVFIGSMEAKEGKLYIEGNGTLNVGQFAAVSLTGRGWLYMSGGGDMNVAQHMFLASHADAVVDLHGDGTALVADYFVTQRGDLSFTLAAGARAEGRYIFHPDSENEGPSPVHEFLIQGTPGSRGVLATAHFLSDPVEPDAFSVVFDGGEWQAKPKFQQYTDLFVNCSAGTARLNAGGGFFNTLNIESETGMGLIGVGKFTKLGFAKFTLSGVNTYTGGTVVESGPLQVTGEINHPAQDVEAKPLGSLIISNGGKVNARSAISNTTQGFEVTGAGSELNLTHDLVLGSDGTGIASVASAGLIHAPLVKLATTSTSAAQLFVNGAAGSSGVLRTGKVQFVSGTGYVFFNGGTFKPSEPTQDMFEDLGAEESEVVLQAGGMIIDTTDAVAATSMPFSGPGGLTKTGWTILQLTGHRTYTGGTVVNDGILVLNTTGTTRPIGDGPLTVAENAFLIGTGRVHGAAQFHGFLIPSGNPGLLTFDSDLRLESTSRTNLVALSASEYSRVTVGGSFLPGGLLELSFQNGYRPSVGTQFQLFTVSTYGGGTFSDIQLIGDGVQGTFNYSTGVLTITHSAPLPELTVTHTGANAVLEWPLSATGWSLMKSTTLAGDSWTAVTEANTPTATHHRVTVPVSGVPRMFFMLQR
jgi:autotransporter-associated beta strand protein